VTPAARAARAVLDTNVLVSALLSATGPPAALLARWSRGELEIVVSGLLLAELERILSRPAVRARLHAESAAGVVSALRDSAVVAEDPRKPGPVRSADPDDDDLIALAYSTQSALVSGDAHLLSLAGRIPVYSPREFLELLEREQ
jgi:putative PIN family toxin of toxin-antitoxin system